MALHLGLVGEALPAEAADVRLLVVRQVDVDLVSGQLLFPAVKVLNIFTLSPVGPE
jgi:hypothetical protein